jgi:hypothetical protein
LPNKKGNVEVPDIVDDVSSGVLGTLTVVTTLASSDEIPFVDITFVGIFVTSVLPRVLVGDKLIPPAMLVDS